jgi:hypothetical protein
VLRGKFIAVSAYILKNRDCSKNLMMHHKFLEKRSKLNTQDQKTIQRMNEINNWFFEKINKISKPLSNMTKCRGKRPKLMKSEVKKET